MKAIAAWYHKAEAEISVRLELAALRSFHSHKLHIFDKCLLFNLNVLSLTVTPNIYQEEY